MVHSFVGRLFQSLQLRQLITIVSGFWSIVTDLEYALRLSSFSWVYHLRLLINGSSMFQWKFAGFKRSSRVDRLSELENTEAGSPHVSAKLGNMQLYEAAWRLKSAGNSLDKIPLNITIFKSKCFSSKGVSLRFLCLPCCWKR